MVAVFRLPTRTSPRMKFDPLASVFPLLEGEDFETFTVIEALPDYFQKAG